MKVLSVALFGLLSLSILSAQADPMLEKATGKGCFICHSMQHKGGPAIPLAPAYADIAARYKDGSMTAEQLADRIVKGTVAGPQHWEGKVNMRFMPPNVNVTQEEAQQLAQWVLSIKPDAVTEEVVSHEGMLALAAQSGCMVCHGVDKQQDTHYLPLAPTYKQVAEKYKSNPEGKKLMVDAMLNGTISRTEHWDNVNMRFMPPNPALKAEDAEKIATWILTL
jgi:cytochrome c